MSGFLLDTNVVSEMMRHRPSPQVTAFLTRQTEFWLASLVVHELEFGLQLTPLVRRRERLRSDLSRFLGIYAERILDLDRASAEWAAQLRADAARAGRPSNLADALIAGTAKAHDLAIATRNVQDFEGMDIDIVNPWNHP